MQYLEKARNHKWIVGILALAIFLRLYHLGFQSAWLDEVHTLKESDPILSLSQFHETIMFREGIPHFYFLIVRFLSEILGSSILVARIPSAVAGIASVWFIYLLGKELYNERAGLIAAAFLTFNLFHIEFSQEARSYSMLAFFTILSFYYLVKFLKDITLKNALLLGLFAGLITNSQPIGLVNVGSIYLILFVALIAGESKNTKKLLLYSFVAGIVTLIVFSPVLQIVMKVAEIKNMWIPAPTFDSILQVFVLLSGNSKVVLLVTIIFAAGVLFMGLKNIREQKVLLHNKALFAFVVLFMWILVSAGVIIIKSYTGESIVLHRYFIGILPALMLFPAIGISLIGNRIVRIASIAFILSCLVFALFSPNSYYTTLTKSQYDKVSEEVIKRNVQKDRVVSNWGWLMSYYYNHDNKNKPVLESPLETYVEDLKNGAGSMGSFWYVDGNSRPYQLNPELDQYLKANFVLTDKIEMVDAWAYHFKATNIDTSNLVLDLANFEAAMFDGSGAMIFVENKTAKYPPMFLEKGKYKLMVKGVSLPEKPIDGENAHFNLLIDGVKVGEFSMSEKKDAAPIEVGFEIGASKEISLQLNYDNDIVVGADDRNAVVNLIKIVKQ